MSRAIGHSLAGLALFFVLIAAIATWVSSILDRVALINLAAVLPALVVICGWPPLGRAEVADGVPTIHARVNLREIRRFDVDLALLKRL